MSKRVTKNKWIGGFLGGGEEEERERARGSEREVIVPNLVIRKCILAKNVPSNNGI